MKPKCHRLRHTEVQNPGKKSKNHCGPGDASDFLQDYWETNEWEREERSPHVSAPVPAATKHGPCGPEAGQLDSCVVGHGAVLRASLGNLGLP